MKLSFSDRKILIVAPEFPYPPNSGGRLDIWGRVKVLSELGFSIDLIATVNFMPSDEEMSVVRKYVKRIILCERDVSLRNNLSILPLQLTSRNALLNVKLDCKYDLVLLETQHVFSIVNNSKLRTSAIILRAQNDEFKYFKQLFKSVNWSIAKLYYFIEAYKILLLDRKIIKKIDNYMFISNDEYNCFKTKDPSKNSIFLPPSIDALYKPRKSNSKKVLFIGSLYIGNIQEAIIWYIKNVHPILSDVYEYELLIAGNSRGKSLSWLLNITNNYDNITVFDSPPDLKNLYDSCSVFINPMLHGAGLKLKTIEAIRHGLPVVSTTIGNQGTGLKHMRDIYVSDDPDKFAAFIKDILINPDKGEQTVTSAQQYLRQAYNHKAILYEYFTPLLKMGDKK